ncbi:hypothetical protein Pcinc_003619 [Petrolisthes cinctipes]|uniref:Uncharacterized protein n=1 Tax=Petrolisthes cinctipes TaxID=88211 RepID=A0AAE1GG10_PETCI|nr:hypothetical protein Pcinc_003619 [Petrolisthes cinctipes]
MILQMENEILVNSAICTPRGALVMVMLLAWVALAEAEADTPPQKASTEEKSAVDNEEGKLFLKSYSTTTWTFLSSFTSTIPYTCFATLNGQMACMGRRRLRRSRNINIDSTADDSSVHSSGSEDETLDAEEKANEEKFFFRLFRTVSSTATITTFSTNRSLTVSASAMCTFPGFTFTPC